jgi:hypothetical protein
MFTITTAHDGTTVSDTITTAFEPWPQLPGRFMAYKNGRACPMTCWAADADGILHPIPEQRWKYLTNSFQNWAADYAAPHGFQVNIRANWVTLHKDGREIECMSEQGVRAACEQVTA